MGSISARHARDVLANTQRVLAVELLCAAQGIDFRAPWRSRPGEWRLGGASSAPRNAWPTSGRTAIPVPTSQRRRPAVESDGSARPVARLKRAGAPRFHAVRPVRGMMAAAMRHLLAVGLVVIGMVAIIAASAFVGVSLGTSAADSDSVGAGRFGHPIAAGGTRFHSSDGYSFLLPAGWSASEIDAVRNELLMNALHASDSSDGHARRPRARDHARPHQHGRRRHARGLELGVAAERDRAAGPGDHDACQGGRAGHGRARRRARDDRRPRLVGDSRR